MHRRRGVLALWLLLALSGMAAVLGSLAFSAAHGARTAERLRQGLAAQYAAESGAVWGLLYIKENTSGEVVTVTFSVNPETETKVVLTPLPAESAGDAAGGEETAPRLWHISSRGTDLASGVTRQTVLAAEEAEGPPRTITVTEVTNDE